MKNLNLIEQAKWSEDVKDKVVTYLKSIHIYVVDGKILLTEDSVKGLVELLDYAMEAAETQMCEDCDGRSPDDFEDWRDESRD